MTHETFLSDITNTILVDLGGYQWARPLLINYYILYFILPKEPPYLASSAYQVLQTTVLDTRSSLIKVIIMIPYVIIAKELH